MSGGPRALGASEKHPAGFKCECATIARAGERGAGGCRGRRPEAAAI